jgi:hypothetical protein
VTRCGTETFVATSLGEGARLEQAHGGRAKVEYGNNSPARFSQVLGEQVAIAETKTDTNKESSEDFKVAIKNTEAVSDDATPASEGLTAQTLAGAAAPKTMPMPTAAKKATSHEDTQSHIAQGEQDLSPPFSTLVEGQDRVTKEGSCENDLTAQTSDDEVSHKVESKSAAWRAPLEQEATTAKVSLSSQNQPGQTVARKIQQTMGADISDTSPVEPSKSNADALPSEQGSAAIFPSQVSDTAEQSSQATAHVAPKSSTQNATAYLSANSHRSSPSFEAGAPQRAQSSLGRMELSSQQRSTLSTQEPSVDASDESQSDSASQLKQPDHSTPTPQSASKIQESSTPQQVSSHRVSPAGATPIKNPAVSAAAQEPTSDVHTDSSDQAQPSKASTSDSVPDETTRTDASQTSAAMVAALQASNSSWAPAPVQGQVRANSWSSTHASLETAPTSTSADSTSRHTVAPLDSSPRHSTTAGTKTTSSVPEFVTTTAGTKTTSSVPESTTTPVSSTSQEAQLTARVASATSKVHSMVQPSVTERTTVSAASPHVGQALKEQEKSDKAPATAEIASDEAPVTTQTLSDEAPATAEIVSDKTLAPDLYTTTPDKPTLLHVESTTESQPPRTNKKDSPAPIAAHAEHREKIDPQSAHERTAQNQPTTNAPTILLTPPSSQEPRSTKSESPPKVTPPTASTPVTARAPATRPAAVQANAQRKADTVKTSAEIGSNQAKTPHDSVAISDNTSHATSDQPATASPIQAKQAPVSVATRTKVKSTVQSASTPVKSPAAEEDDDTESPSVSHTTSSASPSPATISPPAASNLSPPKAESSHSVQKQNDTEAPLPSKDVQPAEGPTHATKSDLPSPTAVPNAPNTVLPAQATLILANNNEVAPLEISKPSAIAAEKSNLIDRAVEDPGLSVNVMPHSAHLSIASNTGDLALHVRIRDGNADVNVSGAMAPLFDSKAPEVRAVLAGQGLSLGSYATDQQGGYQGQQGQQGQPDNTPRTSDVLPLPTPHRTTSSTPEVQIADERRIHVTA